MVATNINDEEKEMTENRYELNKNLAQMLKGGVIMDVQNPEQARIAEAAGYNATETGFNDLQKPEFMKHDNHEVAIKIVFDKDSREILGAQMVSHDISISMGIHMFSLAIQEHVTIDKLALTDLFFLPHFNKPYNYITMAALTAEK